MNTLVHGNIWVAFTAASFSLIASSYFQQNPFAFFLLFGGTMFLYGFHRQYKLFVLKQETFQQKELWLKRNRNLSTLLSLFGLGLLMWSFFDLEIWRSRMVEIGVLAAVISLFYVVRIGKRNLREVPYSKILWVTLTYVAFTSLLCFPQLEKSVLIREVLFYLSLWFIVLSITLIFDLRDLHVDDKSQKTWPQILGYKKTIRLAIGLNLMGLIGLAYATGIGIWFASLSIGLSMLGFYFYAKGEEKELLTSLLFEGLLGVYGWLFYFMY